ncbi:MAG: cellulase family glycosylhydrolase [Chloroflexi bacterium]|nr:cellulase family glycosylhydrolase [Chloroflexota bacterium]MBP8059227.1 cellulase family glycosylhydrolase [Chloroflexota bacterium]
MKQSNWPLALWLIFWLIGCQRDVPATILPASSPHVATIIPLPGTQVVTATPSDRQFYAPLLSNTQATPISSVTSATPLIPSVTPAATLIPSVTPAATVIATATLTSPLYVGPPLSRSSMGIQIYLHREDVPHLMGQLRELGVGWVKVQVSWKLYQPAPDQYSDELFGELDELVHAAGANNIAVLLSVSKAPEWSRPTTELDGPPLDNALFQQFMAKLAQRYEGQVAAYELWNEPNLQREWNGMPLDAAALLTLIQAGAEGARSADPTALIISAAPAVTGINDGLSAIDDRVYFRAMLSGGLAEIVDGFGVHPYGWANPPETTVAAPDASIPSHNNHPSFFFRDTLQDYGALLNEWHITDKKLWVTEFGWGSFEGLGEPPPPEATFMAYVSEWQQALYTQQAFALAHTWPWVGPMMLWNLNFSPWIGPAFSESGYSLLRPDGSPRPAYFALMAIPKD